MEGDNNPDNPQASETPVGAPPPPPSEPPPYSAPPAPSSSYSPPSVATPTQVPPAYEQQFGAPFAPYAPPPVVAPKRNRGRMLLVIGVIVVVVLAALGGGAAFANAQLSSTYSPQKAVTDYFAALAKGDFAGMMSSATFLHGDNIDSQLFGPGAVAAMMNLDENRSISDVKVGLVTSLDSSTSSVHVTLSWAGTPRDLAYKVRKDTSRVHYFLYDSWRVEIPVTNITVSLPNQPGPVTVDGQSLSSTPSKLEAIQGFHKIEMAQSDFYDAEAKVVDGVDSAAIVAFSADLSGNAKARAAASVKAAFNNVTCDASKYIDCPNHSYTTQPGYSYTVLQGLPGGDIQTTSWSWAFTGDPTTGMKLTVTTEAGKVDASGTCAMTLTVDGGRTYHFAGNWTGTLMWSIANFSSNIIENCDAARA